MTSRPTAALILRISLDGISPAVWRRLLVSDRTTLHELHRMAQVLFSWLDYHLYEFRYSDRTFQAPDSESEGEDATRVTLRDLKLAPGDRFTYVYDFGDDWTHLIEVEDRYSEADPHDLPVLLDGERSGPPEDCGGPESYMQLLATMTQPLEDLTDEDRNLAEWAGLDFDPEAFDIFQLRRALQLCAAWGVLKRR